MVAELFTEPIQALTEVERQLQPDLLRDLDLALQTWLKRP